MNQTVRKTLRVLSTFIFLCVHLPVVAQVADAKDRSKGAAPSVSVRADADAGLAGETPLDTSDVPDPTDVSLEGSPVAAAHRASWIRAETPLRIRLNASISSGAQRNGDTVTGTLVDSVKTSNGTILAAGTPIKATVLSAAAAGKVQSAGVLSLQVLQVDGLPVITNVLEFAGQEGRREVADANPDKGTEASVPAETLLSFRVLGSGDKPDPNERAESSYGGNTRGGSVRPGQSSVGPPSSPTKPGSEKGITTDIHGVTTPH